MPGLVSSFPTVSDYPTVTFRTLHYAQCEGLDESDIPKEGSYMEVDLFRRAPGSIALIRERRWTSDCAKKVHSPFCSLSCADINIEKTQWDLDVGDPQLVGVGEICGSSNTICSQVGDIETVERSTSRPRLRRIIN